MTVALPSSWKEAPIGTLCVNTEQVTPDAEAEFIYVDIASVDRETKKITSPQRMLGKDAPSRARKLIKTGDTIVSTTRPNLNAVALVDQALDGQIASTGFDVLRAPGLDPRWLGYLVRTSAFVDAMSSLVQGALYPAIRGKDVRSFVTPIAPANEQKRIADKLDTVLTRVDAVNTRLARVAPLLKRFRQSVLAAATSGRLTQDWRKHGPFEAPEKKLSEIGTVSGGLTKNAKRDSLPLRQPYLRVANVHANELRLDDVSDIGLTASEFNKTKLEFGDLLIVEGNGSIEQIGRVAMWRNEIENCCHQNHLIRWRNLETSIAQYVLMCLMSPAGRSQIVSVASSTTGLHTLSVSKVGEISVLLPSLKEQTEIVRRVETLFAFADRLEARLAQAQTAATRLTPALLAKAFRGELVPQDPNDEPASELLRRLSQAPAAASPRKGRKAAGVAA